MNYCNKAILAPMVRTGCLSFRLLALEYGADIVYGEEIIDQRIIHAKRVVNDVSTQLTFCVQGYPKPVFQTCAQEKGKVVFQVGTCNAETALQACKVVENDVDAIDVNMGCPKAFSTQGGMGSALLKKPEKIKEILTTLVNGLNKPVTCKIRCLHLLEDTIELCKMIENCGVKAIAVHGRFQEERPRHPNHDDYIREIAKVIKIPVIANGGSNVMKEYADIAKFKESCGASSVLVGRAAQWNCSIFRKEGTLPIDDVIRRFLLISLETNNFFYNTKYVVQHILHAELQSERGLAVLASECNEDIYKLFGLLDELKAKQQKEANSISQDILVYSVDSVPSGNDEDDMASAPKKFKSMDDIDTDKKESKNMVICKHAKFSKKEFKDSTKTPKAILFAHALQNNMHSPVYTTEEKLPERIFKSTVEFNGVRYTTPCWEPNKRNTEQAAAMVCLQMLKIDYIAIQTSDAKTS